MHSPITVPSLTEGGPSHYPGDSFFSQFYVALRQSLPLVNTQSDLETWTQVLQALISHQIAAWIKSRCWMRRWAKSSYFLNDEIPWSVTEAVRKRSEKVYKFHKVVSKHSKYLVQIQHYKGIPALGRSQLDLGISKDVAQMSAFFQTFLSNYDLHQAWVPLQS